MTIRSAGSKGPYDVVAFNDRMVRLIQVKSTKPHKIEANRKAYLKYMRDIPPCATNELWLYVKQVGQWGIVWTTHPELEYPPTAEIIHVDRGSDHREGDPV